MVGIDPATVALINLGLISLDFRDDLMNEGKPRKFSDTEIDTFMLSAITSFKHFVVELSSDFGAAVAWIFSDLLLLIDLFLLRKWLSFVKIRSSC